MKATAQPIIRKRNTASAKAGEQDAAQAETQRNPRHPKEDENLGHHSQGPQQSDQGLAIALIHQVDGVEDVERAVRGRHQHGRSHQVDHLALAHDVDDRTGDLAAIPLDFGQGQGTDQGSQPAIAS
jgi:hypothetical protein